MHSVRKIISNKMKNEISYKSFKYFIDNDKTLFKSREIGKEKELLKLKDKNNKKLIT